MKEYKADKLLQQLKKAYADKVVRNGFDDSNLYNDELLKLHDMDLKKFEELKKIIGKSKAAEKTKDIDVNNQGLTDEEYEEQEKLKKKPKKELSEEEKARLEELKKKKANRNNAISILRGISIRMPLLIYGADIPYDEEITLDKFIEQVDDSSWDEFMPTGVTKELFAEFRKYYDEDVFIAAGRRIRNIAREADTLNPTNRVKKIASLFAYFKNPDKETVLTPWRVVNMHMSDCLGGYDFFDENHEETIDEPRFVNKGQVTKDTFANPNAQILEINSKTGLYPLYVAYSIYRAKRKEMAVDYEISLDDERDIWKDTIEQNVFVICKTPMAKQITKRTLVGFDSIKINAHYFDDLVNQMQNKQQQFIDRVLKTNYWKKEGGAKMKFDAIVGNPPYMEMDGGAQASARPIYQHFVSTAKSLKPNYLSFIMPTRWYAGGKGLDDFRNEMLDDIHIEALYDCISPEDIFPNTNIRGGVCYFLWNSKYNNHSSLAKVYTMESGKETVVSSRPLKVEGLDIFIRYNTALTILNKVQDIAQSYMDSYISPRKPFGLEGNFIKDTNFHTSAEGLNESVVCYGKAKARGFIERSSVRSHLEWVDAWKVYMPYANNIGTELNDDNQNTFIGEPGSCCTETFLSVGHTLGLSEKMAKNLSNYLRTKFARFLLSLAKISQHGTSKTYCFVPIVDFNEEWTDEKLYKKFGLLQEEINFIESSIKKM